jgi:hypothetical protein
MDLHPFVWFVRRRDELVGHRARLGNLVHARPLEEVLRRARIDRDQISIALCSSGRPAGRRRGGSGCGREFAGSLRAGAPRGARLSNDLEHLIETSPARDRHARHQVRDGEAIIVVQLLNRRELLSSVGRFWLE